MRKSKKKKYENKIKTKKTKRVLGVFVRFSKWISPCMLPYKHTFQKNINIFVSP